MKRKRRNHSASFKAKVAIAVVSWRVRVCRRGLEPANYRPLTQCKTPPHEGAIAAREFEFIKIYLLTNLDLGLRI